MILQGMKIKYIECVLDSSHAPLQDKSFSVFTEHTTILLFADFVKGYMTQRN